MSTETGSGGWRKLEGQMANWAREGAEIALAHWRRTGDLQFKSGHEAVTSVDREVEILLRERIAAAWPDDHIVGEEFGSDGSASAGARVWQIDPIDGTLNFALGLPGFCISMAVLQGDTVEAACVLVPVTADVFTATRGRGARLNGEPMSVSRRAPLAEAVVSAHFKKDGRFVSNPLLLQAVHRETMKIRRTGAIALELAWLAAGSYDALVAGFAGTIQLYDVAAGLLLVTEAGGRISDHRGRPYRPEGADLVVSNGLVHEELLALMERFA